MVKYFYKHKYTPFEYKKEKKEKIKVGKGENKEKMNKFYILFWFVWKRIINPFYK